MRRRWWVVVPVAVALLAGASDARGGAGEKAAAKLAAAIDGDDAAAVLALLPAKVQIEGKRRTRAWVKRRMVQAGNLRFAFEIQACAWEISVRGRDTLTWCAGDRDREVVTMFRIRKGKVRAITREAGELVEISSGLEPTASVFNEIERAPWPRLKIDTPTVSGPLAAGVVHRHLKRHLGSVNHCYQLAREEVADLTGRVRLDLEIDAAGRVAVTSATSLHPTVDACLMERLAAMELPHADGVTTVAVEISFDLYY